ncbi:DUF551 domain-containing protein [Yersinia enterocolitica]|uniref:DUF551 domain-containing protein n=1 Tax=Yersinia enterocolitica TaxID=630 RepID=UPI0022FED408|nr:DUF551 domain-containing protein [Yersinia enterocolitica]MDA5531734.1 DUF551 domain-containing protein [Yersinia enterocolitica]
MKELDSFTVEQLNDFIKSDHAQCGDVAALARIALAAKRAEPVTWWTGPEPTKTGELESYHDHETGSHYLPLVVSLSAYNTTPQLNSPEIPDSWKLVPIEPTQNMVDAHISGMQLAGFSRAYRDMLAAAPEPQKQQQNIPEIILQGWIKCSDQMPEDDEYYLTHSTAGVDVTIFHDGRFQDEYATHWMPLPAAPESE